MSTQNLHTVWGKEGNKAPFIDELKTRFVVRNIKKRIHNITKSNSTIIDVGCGYSPRILNAFKNIFEHKIGLDFEVSNVFKSDKQFIFYEGDILDTIKSIPSNSADVIVFLSILEHLDNVFIPLAESHRILKKGGFIYLCSPSWFGKWVLENIVSNKILDPHGEIEKQYNTHKMYFSVRDIWPIIVRAGFISSEIKLWYSNLFCSISGCIKKLY